MRWWEIVGMEEPSGDTPSVSHSLDSSLREGAGNGCGGLYHLTGYSLNRKGAGDFHRPYETQNVLHFTVQWRLSQSGCKKVYEFIVAWEF